MSEDSKAVKNPRVPFSVAAEFGGTDTYDSMGNVREDLFFDLQGAAGRRAFRKMTYDSTISSVLFMINMILRQTEWSCIPKDINDPKAVEYSDYFDSIRKDMYTTWEQFISNVLSMIVFGWSLFEIVGKRRLGTDAKIPSKYNDGLWGIHKLAIRPQETLDHWEINDKGELVAFWQDLRFSGARPYTQGLVRIPIEKCLLFRAQFWNDSPEGISCLRGAHKDWLYLNSIERAEAYGIERELNGMPVMYVPAELIEKAEAGDAKAAAALNSYRVLVRDIRLNRQAGAVLPSNTYMSVDGNATAQKQYFLELIASSGRRAIDVTAAAERHQVAMARCVLADFLMLGTSSRVGSQSLGDSRIKLCMNALDGWNRSIADVFNEILIPHLAKYNMLDETKLPTYQPQSADPISISALVESIEKYQRAGGSILPDQNVDKTVRSKMGLPASDPRNTAAGEFDPTLDPDNLDNQEAQGDNKQTRNTTVQRNELLQA